MGQVSHISAVHNVELACAKSSSKGRGNLRLGKDDLGAILRDERFHFRFSRTGQRCPLFGLGLEPPLVRLGLFGLQFGPNVGLVR